MARAQAIRVRHPAGRTRRQARHDRVAAVLRAVRIVGLVFATFLSILVFLAISAIGASMQETPTSVGVSFPTHALSPAFPRVRQ